MPREARFRPVRYDALGTEGSGAVGVLLLGLFLVAGGLVLMIACVGDLASPASAAGSGSASLAIGDQRALLVLTLHSREVEAGGCKRSVRDQIACVGQHVAMAPATRRLAPTASREHTEECPVRGSYPDAADVAITSDLRCDLAAMAAADRRAGFVYVGPR